MPSGVQTCALDRKSTRLNSSHGSISYAVFCLKKKHYSLNLTCITTPRRRCNEPRPQHPLPLRWMHPPGTPCKEPRIQAPAWLFFFFLKGRPNPRILPLSPTPPPSP